MRPEGFRQGIAQFCPLLLRKRRWSGRFACKSYRISVGSSLPASLIVGLEAATASSKLRARHMLTQIRFGTSGWRAVIAEEFTFSSVQRAVGGIARYVASQKR